MSSHAAGVQDKRLFFKHAAMKDFLIFRVFSVPLIWIQSFAQQILSTACCNSLNHHCKLFYLVGVDGTDGMDCIEGVGGTRRIYLMLVFGLQNRFRVGWPTLRS